MRILRVNLLFTFAFILMSISLFAQQFNSDSTSDYTIEKLFNYSLDELLTLKVSSATKFEESINEITYKLDGNSVNRIINSFLEIKAIK